MRPLQNLSFWLLSILAGLGLALVVLWFRGDLHPRPDAVPAAAVAVQPGTASYAAAVRLASPAVVNIYANKTVTGKQLAHITNPAIQRILGVQGVIVPTRRLERSLGSGVLVSRDGLILTNDHVIQGADDIQVLLADGREVAAEVVGTDPETDLAVLRIPLDDLPFLNLTEPAQVQVGDVVLAIGNPFGLNQTVTQGIISALQRGGSPEAPLAHFIQTDAPINEGNSGGALINTRGELVGINVATLTGVQHIQGISFAIPTALARYVLEEIQQHGRVRRGWLGVEADLNYPALASRNAALPQGIRVAGVHPGSPAEAAGLMAGDVLMEVDGFRIDPQSNVQAYIASLKPGTRIHLRWWSSAGERDARVTLGLRPVPEDSGGPVRG